MKYNKIKEKVTYQEYDKRKQAQEKAQGIDIDIVHILMDPVKALSWKP